MKRFIFLVLLFYCCYVSSPRLTEYPRIISQIDTISRKLNQNIDNINNGGCGYFAYYLTNILDSAEIPYEISIINLNKHKNHITHVLIYLPDYNLFLDSRGMQRCLNINGTQIFYCVKVGQTITKSELKHALTTFKWNKKFNVSDTIKIKTGLRF